MLKRAAAIVTLLVLGLVPAGVATEDVEEPIFERQEAWFHAHTLPVGNLDASEGRYVVWDDEEPTGATPAAYHGNNYAGIVEGDHIPDHFFTAEGTFTGDLDTIAFDAYLHGWAQSTIRCGLSLSFDFRIDGRMILYQDYLGSAGIHYEPAGAGVVKARFALTNIWEAMQRRGIETGPDVEHTVYVNIQNFYLCNEVTWLYDAGRTPSGLIANVEDPAAEGYFEIDVLSPPPPLS